MAYGIVNVGAKNPISDEKTEKTSTWSSEKVSAALAKKFGYMGETADADSATTPGIYSVDGGTGGLPEDLSENISGSLLVMNTGGGVTGWCTQILTGYNSNGGTEVFRRRVYDDVHSVWLAWQDTPCTENLKTLQDRVGTNESAIRTAQSSLSSLYDGSVTGRGDITAAKLSDLDITQSGIYNVRISAQFSIDGSSDIQDGGGLLIVFGRDDHSALQLWLLLDWNRRNDNCRMYWRFLQTEDDSGEGYVLPSTTFKQLV